jgi:type II secretory pathway component PulF
MEVFAYRAVDPEGNVVTGEIAGEQQPTIHATLAERHLTLVDLQAQKPRGVRLRMEKYGASELIEFTRNLGSLIAASIPLLSILEDLEDQADQAPWRRLIRSIRLRIAGGATMREAFAARPDVFSEVYLSLVAAGEESGRLPEVFAKLTAHLEWSRNLKEELRHAITYPVIVLGAVGVLIAILTFFVFPRLGEVLLTLDVELPLPTRIILALGHFAQRTWPIILATPIVLGILLNQIYRRPRGRLVLDAAKLNAPVIGSLVSMIVFSRMSGTLATLLGAGVQLDRALSLTRGAVGNRVVANAINETADSIQAGDTLTEALERTGTFPRILLRMTRVGENSGDVSGMLARCNEHYDRLIPIRIRRLLSAFGPAMVVFLAMTVGVAALSIFLPLLQIGAALH